MNKSVFIGLLVLGTCFFASAQTFHRGAAAAQATRIRLANGDYDCSCSYYCPAYGVQAGPCYDGDYWGWGMSLNYCCVPSYLDYDTPDRYDYYRRRR